MKRRDLTYELDKLRIENAFLKEEIKYAVLHEKVKRLEYFFYGAVGMIILQLIALFALWAKGLFSK